MIFLWTNPKNNNTQQRRPEIERVHELITCKFSTELNEKLQKSKFWNFIVGFQFCSLAGMRVLMLLLLVMKFKMWLLTFYDWTDEMRIAHAPLIVFKFCCKTAF